MKPIARFALRALVKKAVPYARRLFTRTLPVLYPYAYRTVSYLAVFRKRVRPYPSAAVWSMPLCRVLWFLFSINYFRKKSIKYGRVDGFII